MRIDFTTPEWKAFKEYAVAFYAEIYDIFGRVAGGHDPENFTKLLEKAPTIVELYEQFKAKG